MSSPQLDVLLSTVSESVDATFVCDGVLLSLSEFDGVVARGDGDGGVDEGPFFRWRAVSLGDSYGIELESRSGTVHTHSLSYFTGEVVADRYRPALVDGDVVVPARRESASPGPADDRTPASGTDEVDRFDAVADDRDGRDETLGSDDAAVDGPDDGRHAPGSHAQMDTDSDTETGVERDAETPDERAADVDGEGDTETPDEHVVDVDSEGDAETPDERVVDADGEEDAEGDAESLAESPGETPDERDADVDATEIARLESVATDPTHHPAVRENAVYELAEYGTDAVEALTRVAASDVGTRECALAAECIDDLEGSTDDLEDSTDDLGEDRSTT